MSYKNTISMGKTSRCHIKIRYLWGKQVMSIYGKNHRYIWGKTIDVDIHIKIRYL